MATFAVMSGNSVSNVIVADTKEIAEQVTGSVCIEYTEENPAGIGWTHDGINFIPSYTVEEEVPVEKVVEEVPVTE
jgi:hypothetical protein